MSRHRRTGRLSVNWYAWYYKCQLISYFPVIGCGVELCAMIGVNSLTKEQVVHRKFIHTKEDSSSG